MTTARLQGLDVLSRLLVVIAAATVIAAGCGRVSLPPTAVLTEIVPSGRAAKPATCDMPVLRNPPAENYRQVAIIEGRANVFAKEADVMPMVVQKACEAGADAIIVKDSRSQTSENYTGYFVNAVAIIYPKPGEKVGNQ